MTDKEQIIINGVDVSGCVHFDKYFLPNNNEEFKDCALSELYYREFEHSCADNPNCYFKQLARKTQECDTLKSQLDFEAQQKKLDEYKQSLDEKNKFLQDLGISASGEFKRIKLYIESLKNKYNEKVKECEELKEQLQANQPTGICETCTATALLQNDKDARS